MKATVFTLGCRVNATESECIMAMLEKNGWETSGNFLPDADICVLNTCAVTRAAESKSRQLVARARSACPNALIFVCGCASQKNPVPFEEKGVYFVTGSPDKEKAVINAVNEKFGGTANEYCPPKQIRARGYIKIQDGCNNFCSYCIIPYLRGREVSRPIEEVVEEVESCVCPEVVLNGVNLSSYGGEGGLIRLFNALKGVKKRIRLGSLECSIIDDDFLSAAKGLYDFAPHFHLSLQSGSNAVLKAMNRRYTREQYIQKCNLVYSAFPDACITTDVITGFPTETEEDFKQTLSVIDEVEFGHVHAFCYSAREHTAAYKLKCLPEKVREDRATRVLYAGVDSTERFSKRFEGKELSFVAESYKDGKTRGQAGNFITVYVEQELELCKIYKARVREISVATAICDLI